MWIAGAAGLTMVVMFALGRARGQAWDELFIAAVSLAIAAVPEALPTVAQTILSKGGVDLARRNAIVKDLPSVETLGVASDAKLVDGKVVGDPTEGALLVLGHKAGLDIEASGCPGWPPSPSTPPTS